MSCREWNHKQMEILLLKDITKNQWMDLVVNYMELKTKLGNWAKFRRKYADRFTETEG